MHCENLVIYNDKLIFSVLRRQQHIPLHWRQWGNITKSDDKD